MKQQLEQSYAEFKSRGLKLNMARGKPAADQLDLSMPLFNVLSKDDYKDVDGTDLRNYGNVQGIVEARRLFGQILDMPEDQVFVCGNASLNIMFDTLTRAYVKGVLPGFTPWGKLDKVKFLCPAPGYDRHFSLCEYFNIEMISVPMLSDGPDMDEVERLAMHDEAVKGIWCVPMYSNPDGITYSDEVVRRLASMPVAAADFRIFWDNAYCMHHLDPKNHDHLANIYKACAAAGHEDRVYMYASTSKVTFAGAGISAMAASPDNIAYAVKLAGLQTIGFDKINMLRHVRFLPDLAAIEAHMAKQAEIVRPKFDMVVNSLEKEIAPLGIGTWHNPKGGYFVSFYSMDGCAKRIIALCKEGGVVLTGAGATFPYGKDPHDRNIRIAPTFPPVAELAQAMELFCIAVKLASVEKLLEE